MRRWPQVVHALGVWDVVIEIEERSYCSAAVTGSLCVGPRGVMMKDQATGGPMLCIAGLVGHVVAAAARLVAPNARFARARCAMYRAHMAWWLPK